MTTAFRFQTQHNGLTRLVKLHSLLASEGLVRVEALDGQKPAWLDLSPHLFPWKDLALYLVQAWRASQYVPRAFRPEQRIPPEILDALSAPTLSHSDALEILKSLRKNQFLPAIRQENRPKAA